MRAASCSLRCDRLRFGIGRLVDEFRDDAANPLSVGRFLKKSNIVALRRNGMCDVVVGGEDNGWNVHFRIAPQILNDGKSGFAISWRTAAPQLPAITWQPQDLKIAAVANRLS